MPGQPLAVSLGDPAGIGPEVVAKSWEKRREEGLPPFFAIGDINALKAVWSGPIAPINTPETSGEVFDQALPLLQVSNAPVTPGEPSMEGARTALDSLEAAVGLARSDAAAGVVTGPVSKAQLHAIGFVHPGQTEFVAERCGVDRANIAMMLAGPTLRVVPVTTHVALRAVPELLSTEAIMAAGRAAIRGLQRQFGIERPRVAVAGLNPHAGESGMLGTEDQDVVLPAVLRLQEEGHDVRGPLPPDIMFNERQRRSYDLALCMYHDQALIPLKTLHFDEGINMTLGLPIVRTSPDHGTAFDIAGQNIAHPGAMIAAIRIAGECARRMQAG